MGIVFSERLIYDDACHLKKYSLNPVRREVTEVAEVLNSLDMVVDELHF